MNILCRNILQGFKNDDADESLLKLIDAILAFDGPIEAFDEESLNKAESQLPANGEQKEDATRREDYRIESIAFSNFRTFPETNDKPYGLSFAKEDGSPCSLFLVGKNGTGKSTIFDALELLYSGKVKNAENRGIKERDSVKEYLTYGFGKINDIPTSKSKIKIRLKDMTGLDEDWITLDKIPTLCVPALCCSDMDIEEISKLDDDAKPIAPAPLIENFVVNPTSESEFQRYIRGQLGYSELTLLRNRLIAIMWSIGQHYLAVKARMPMAGLTSADLKEVQESFTKMVESGFPQILSWEEEVDKFIELNEIKKIKDVADLKTFIEPKNTLFPDKWDELIKNIDTLRSLEKPVQNIGGYLQDDNSNGIQNQKENLNDVILEIMDKLHVMYLRIKKACDTYREDKDKKGLMLSFENLSNDYNEFLNNKNKLPIKSRELISQMIKDRDHLGAIVKLINEINKILPVLFDKRKNGEQNADEDFKKVNKFIEHILNHYKDHTEKFKVDSTPNSFEVKIEVNDNNGHTFETSPRKYLNTFRYRLYAVLLKIALSLYYMKSTQCVAPIIIDDVFNASDFENSISLSAFVYHIIEIYREVIGGQKPLQLIILSHDEMIASSFRQGMMMKSDIRLKEENADHQLPKQEDYCLYGRLFPYGEAGNVEKAERKAQGDVYKERSFQNLYLQIN